jgi:hypothetical protein
LSVHLKNRKNDEAATEHSEKLAAIQIEFINRCGGKLIPFHFEEKIIVSFHDLISRWKRF